MTLDITTEDIRTLLDARLPAEGQRWLTGALHRIGSDAAAIRTLFPAAGRRCGRGLLSDTADGPYRHLRGWTVDDAARTVMLGALPLPGAALGDEVEALYRYGDAAEKRGVLRALGVLDASGDIGGHGVPLVHDALRTNDTRLIAAALGRYGAARLDPPAYRQGVLKCVFVGIPLDDIDGLPARADAELARMLADYAHERAAAGREIPADVWKVVDPNDPSRPREA